MNNIENLVNILELAKEAYYKGEPSMSDEAFDAMEDDLRKLDPLNTYFSTVGSDKLSGKKITHKYPMLSMGKAKTVGEVEAWYNKIVDGYSPLLIIEPKIDGLSASIVYNKGKLQYIATRGDGTTGQDISHISEYMNIPKSIPDKCYVEVRGELYLPKNTKISNPDFKPLRNIAVGLINRKENYSDLKHLKFVAYQVISDLELKFESEKINYCNNIGFNTVVYKTGALDLVEAEFNAYLAANRDAWEYETDGLIISVNDNDRFKEINAKYVVDRHNHYNIALKPPAQGKETVFRDVEWQVSRQGCLIPVGVFDPIVISGSTIKRASLCNFRMIVTMGLNKGDRIYVVKANDVIPKIESNLSYKEGRLCDPTFKLSHCPVCGSSTVMDKNNVQLKCSNSVCPERSIQSITHWCTSCNMDGVSEATARLLYDKGIVKSAKDLYSIKDTDLIGIPGLGDSKIKNILFQIELSKKMSIIEFIDRLGIPSIGEKAAKKLGLTSIKKFLDFSDDKSSVIGACVVAFKSDNINYIKELISVLEITEVVEGASGKEKVCMTGKGPKSRNDLIADIEAMGYEFIDSITKETNILICEDTNGASSKLAKAKKMGIILKSYEDFFKK